MKKFLLSLVFAHCFFTITSFAQDIIIRGKVSDVANDETLPGVNVVLEDKKGTVTDLKGKYSLTAVEGKHTLTFSFIGYKTKTKEITLEKGKDLVLDVQLKTDAKVLQISTVTVSQYEKNLSQETVTMDVISPALIKNTNARELSEIVYKTPGVQIQDGQVSIRGGSGFSYGVGSRVAILIDNQGAMSGDLGDGKWKFVPIENAQQVEVIKGASSVLYGSSALNGVINVQTGWAKELPETEINVFSGIYDNPKRKQLIWWNKNRTPWFWGGSFNHRQRFGNLDFVAGANVNYNFNYLQNADERRARISFKTKYTDPKTKRTSFGVNVNFMNENSTRFFLPIDLNDSSLYKLDGSNDQYTLAMVDPHFTHFDKKNNRHIVRGRWFNVFRKGNGDDPNANSNLLSGEYQFQSNVKSKVFITSGLMGSYGFSTSNLFPGLRTTWAAAVYSQLEYKPIPTLTLVGGARYEVTAVDTLVEATKPVFRTGLNWEAGKATNIRASWGQAYRLPSVGERFIAAEFAGGINIIPNPDLKAETGWSAEVGLKQGIKVSNWMGYFDLSLFWMEFTNQVEYRFQINSSGVGLRPRNIQNSRVAGYEVSLIGKGKIGPIGVTAFGGYTYSYPGNLDGDSNQRNAGTYLSNMFKYYGKIEPSDTAKVMQLRNKHIVRFDLQLDYKSFSIGASTYYNSFPDKIDGVYYLVFNGLAEFTERRKNGDWVMDLRASVKIKKHLMVSVITKNLTNLEYANRPGVLEPPRNYTLQLRYTF